jgi:hypothetical protein
MINHADNTSGSDRQPRPGLNNKDGVLRDLSQPVQAPDLTRCIMGRLGYMQVPPTVARRHRLRRFAGRIGLVSAAALVASAGVYMHLHGPDARRPADMTIPAAIGSDVERQHQRFDSVIQTIRSLTPIVPSPSSDQQHEPPPKVIDDDVNRSSIGPVQWV